jgi:hypothetical protein
MNLQAQRIVLWSTAWLAIAGLDLQPSLAQPRTPRSYSAPQQRSLCPEDEATTFSCPIGRKVVSLCVAGRGSQPGVIRYVFGKPGNVELALVNSLGSDVRVTYGGLSYSGGGGDYVRVRNGPFAYVVYSALGRGWEQEGLVVEKDGHRISAKQCGGPGGALGPNGWQDVYAAHLPPDKEGFEKPD